MFHIAAAAHEVFLGPVPTLDKTQVRPIDDLDPTSIFVVGLNSTSIPLIKSFLESSSKTTVYCYLANESTGVYAGNLTDRLDGSCSFSIGKHWQKRAILSKFAEPPIETLQVERTQTLELANKSLDVKNQIYRQNNKKLEKAKRDWFGDKPSPETERLALDVSGYASRKVFSTENNQKILDKLSKRHQKVENLQSKHREAAEYIFGGKDAASKWPGYKEFDSKVDELKDAMDYNKVQKQKSIQWEDTSIDHIPPSYCQRTIFLEAMVKARFLESAVHNSLKVCRTLEGSIALLRRAQPKYVFFAMEGIWAFSAFGTEFLKLFDQTLRSGKFNHRPLIFVPPSWPIFELQSKYSIFGYRGERASFFSPLYSIYETKSYNRDLGFGDMRSNLFQDEPSRNAAENIEGKLFRDLMFDNKFTLRYFEDKICPISVQEGMGIKRPLEDAFDDINIVALTQRVGWRGMDNKISVPFFGHGTYNTWRRAVAVIITTPELYHILLPMHLYISYLSILRSQQYYYDLIKSRTGELPGLVKRVVLKKAVREILYSTAHFNKNVTILMAQFEKLLSKREAMSIIVTVLEDFYGRKDLLCDGEAAGCNFFENALHFVKIRSDLKRHVSNVELDTKATMTNCRSLIAATRMVFTHFVYHGLTFYDGQYVALGNPDLSMESNLL